MADCNINKSELATNQTLPNLFLKEISVGSSVSDAQLDKLISLQVEMEKTKQQYYKMEYIAKSVEYLKLQNSLNSINEKLQKESSENSDYKPAFTKSNSLENLTIGVRPSKHSSSKSDVSNSRIKFGSYKMNFSSSDSASDTSITQKSGSQNFCTVLPSIKSIISDDSISPKRVVKPVILKSEPRYTQMSPTRKNKSLPRNFSLPLLKKPGFPEIPSDMTSVFSFSNKAKFDNTYTHIFALEKPVSVYKKQHHMRKHSFNIKKSKKTEMKKI